MAPLGASSVFIRVTCPAVAFGRSGIRGSFIQRCGEEKRDQDHDHDHDHDLWGCTGSGNFVPFVVNLPLSSVASVVRLFGGAKGEARWGAKFVGMAHLLQLENCANSNSIQLIHACDARSLAHRLRS